MHSESRGSTPLVSTRFVEGLIGWVTERLKVLARKRGKAENVFREFEISPHPPPQCLLSSMAERPDVDRLTRGSIPPAGARYIGAGGGRTLARTATPDRSTERPFNAPNGRIIKPPMTPDMLR